MCVISPSVRSPTISACVPRAAVVIVIETNVSSALWKNYKQQRLNEIYADLPASNSDFSICHPPPPDSYPMSRSAANCYAAETFLFCVFILAKGAFQVVRHCLRLRRL